MENRNHNRMDMALDCRVSRKAEDNGAVSAQTVNISKGGVLLLWQGAAEPPRVGERVTIEITLPANPQWGRNCIYFHSDVVRVESGEEAVRVAAKTVRTGFRPCRAGTSASEDQVQ